MTLGEGGERGYSTRAKNVAAETYTRNKNYFDRLDVKRSQAIEQILRGEHVFGTQEVGQPKGEELAKSPVRVLNIKKLEQDPNAEIFGKITAELFPLCFENDVRVANIAFNQEGYSKIQDKYREEVRRLMGSISSEEGVTAALTDLMGLTLDLIIKNNIHQPSEGNAKYVSRVFLNLSMMLTREYPSFKASLSMSSGSPKISFKAV